MVLRLGAIKCIKMGYDIQDVAKHIHSEYESFLSSIEDEFTLSSICEARERLYSVISRNERYNLVEVFRTEYYDSMESSFYAIYQEMCRSLDLQTMIQMYVDPRITGQLSNYGYSGDRLIVFGLMMLMSPYVILSPGSKSNFSEDHTYMMMYKEVQRLWVKNIYHVPRAWTKNIGISIYLSDNYYDVLYQHLVDIGNRIKSLDTMYCKVYYVDMPQYDNVVRGLDRVTLDRMSSLLMDIVFIYIGFKSSQALIASRIHKMQLYRLKANNYTFLKILRSREYYDAYVPYWKRPTSEFFITEMPKTCNFSYENVQKAIATLFFGHDRSNVVKNLITFGWSTIKDIVAKGP